LFLNAFDGSFEERCSIIDDGDDRNGG